MFTVKGLVIEMVREKNPENFINSPCKAQDSVTKSPLCKWWKNNYGEIAFGRLPQSKVTTELGSIAAERGRPECNERMER